ncbi:hypothetical protein HanRHA438_Chr15g0687351 [Helianthus annuus]|nr:hypothetical protein HanRHA438_Chr15g0687351 [Helianthus annuus]
MERAKFYLFQHVSTFIQTSYKPTTLTPPPQTATSNTYYNINTLNNYRRPPRSATSSKRTTTPLRSLKEKLLVLLLNHTLQLASRKTKRQLQRLILPLTQNIVPPREREPLVLIRIQPETDHFKILLIGCFNHHRMTRGNYNYRSTS